MSESAPETSPPDDARPVSSADPAASGRSGIVQLVKDVLAFDRLALAILVMVPVCLTVIEYYGLPTHYGRQDVPSKRNTAPPLAEELAAIEMPGPERVQPFVWWSLSCLLLMVLVPMLTAWLFGRLSPRQLGVKLKGTGRDAYTYLFLLLIFAPVIYWASTQPGFQSTYPFYKPPPGPLGLDFLLFELVYCAQFFAVEFFFRGFMVLGLKKRIGWASVLVMLAPYCMIHDYKPVLESLGAIGAGVVLGVLAYRTETIIYGWLLHFSVALSMDLLSLGQQGRLGF